MQDSKPARSAQLGFWLFIGLIALFAGGKAILFDTLDPDCFWHLRVAAQLHRDGIGPIVDDLSFASSRQPWTPYSWLAELGMKSLWDFGGYRAAIAFTAIMQGLIVVLLAGCCVEIQRGKPRYLSAVIATAIGTFLIMPYLSFRPVTAAFVLLFTICWLILRDQRLRNSPGRKAGDRTVRMTKNEISNNETMSNDEIQMTKQSCAPLCFVIRYFPGIVWCVVPLTVLLTNIHLFSFFVPAIILAVAIGAMLEGDRRNLTRYSLLATATALACLATPMLRGLIKTIFFYSSQDKMVIGPVIAEMQSFARGPIGMDRSRRCDRHARLHRGSISRAAHRSTDLRCSRCVADA